VTFEEFCKLPDADKVVLGEARLPFEITLKTWTAGPGSSFYADCSAEGEIVAIEEAGAPYSKQASAAACGAASSSFFYDHPHGRIYARTSGGDSPAALAGGIPKYYLQAYTWVGFTDRQFDDADRIIFKPQAADNPVFYLPYLNSASLSAIEQSVGEYHIGDMGVNFGPVSFFNDGWFYRAAKKYILHNFDLILKIGDRGSAYADFEPVFIGLASDPDTNDETFTVQMTDARFGTLRELPPNRFTAITYPALGQNLEGAVVPILIGEVTGIQPPCCDTISHTYKIHDGAYFGPIEAITNIQVDGFAAAATVDLAFGEFTLTADPANGVVTCDAKGAKCQIGTGLYSAFAGDLAYYILRTLNDFPAAKLDAPAFQALSIARTQTLGWWFNAAMPTMDALRMLMRSAVFHVVPMLDGTFTARYYQAAIPSGTPAFDDVDLADYSNQEKTSSAQMRVVLGYGYQPKSQQYLHVQAPEPNTVYKYKISSTLTIDTMIQGPVDAGLIAAFYLAMNKRPPKYVNPDLPAAALGMIATDKFILSHAVRTIDDQTIAVEAAAVYRALKISKNIHTARAQIYGISDLMAAGQFHADEAHLDNHQDVSHQDSPHGDWQGHNDHQDEVLHGDFQHDDTVHTDNPYGDQGIPHHHTDTPYGDLTVTQHVHTDTPYVDGGHNGHGDSGHWDDPHYDVPHEDGHGDLGHQDSQL